MTHDYLKDETSLMHYTESVYLWRRAHFIGPQEPVEEDKQIARLWLVFWQKHKDAQFSSWINGYFKSSERRHDH